MFMRREREMGEGNIKKRSRERRERKEGHRERKERRKREASPGSICNHTREAAPARHHFSLSLLLSLFQSRSLLPWVKEFEFSEPVRGYLREEKPSRGAIEAKGNPESEMMGALLSQLLSPSFFLLLFLFSIFSLSPLSAF